MIYLTFYVLVQQCLNKGEQHLVIGRDKSYFVKNHSKSNNKYNQDEIIHNSRFGNYLHHIYLIELEINDTAGTHRSASYIYLHLEIDNEERLNCVYLGLVCITGVVCVCSLCAFLYCST
jgi:hypothetical protein